MLNDELNLLKDEIVDCQKCDLRNNTKFTCWDNGNVNSELMLVGEALDVEEQACGLPFVGRAGRYLNRCLLAIGIKRSNIFVSNICMCRPVEIKTNKDRAPTQDEIDICSSYLKRQISLINPKLIVALGKTSFKFLTNSQEQIFKAKANIYNYAYDNTIKVFPLLHPSYIISYAGPEIFSVNWQDWNKLKVLINEYNIRIN